MIENKQKNPYNHPYTPYSIQLDFMKAITEMLDNNYKIGLFESPTGTGKTLSLICSTVSWLREHKQDNTILDEDEPNDDDEPDWVNESYTKLVKKTADMTAENYEKHLSEIAEQKKTRRIKQLKVKKQSQKRFKKVNVAIENDDQFIPADYHSDGDEVDDSATKKTQRDLNEHLNNEISDLLKKIDKKEKDNSSLGQKIKIYFASRTHSQLNQFSFQLRLPTFPSSYEKTKEHLKYLPLGSRKQLCIHEKVSKINDVTLMNEACLDLQKKEAHQRCEFYRTHNQQEIQEKSIEFKDYTFSEIHDIEALSEIGQEIGICPYYAVRKGIPSSEVITLPYQLLLQKTSRDALGISIKDSIIVIDEAHNLPDTITSIHSVNVTIDEFRLCKESLKKYISKFSRRMNGGNRINLMKLVKIIDLVIRYVDKIGKILPGKPIDLMTMFEGTTGDLFNIHKLDKYLTVSKIAFKIESYMDKEERPTTTPVLFKVIDFLKSISNPSKEGKFFFDVKGPKISLVYMLLDPSQVFKEIVDDSKCVVLAGGTMEPMEDYTNYLFPYIYPDRVKKFACGHVIPKENLQVFPVGKNGDVTFEFTFDKRNDVKMISNLGESIFEIIKVVPGGIVIFLPSYKYLSQIIESWNKYPIWDAINSKKKVFSESSSSSSNTILTEYTDVISSGNGAILLSVVGGKLSEGINFSDDLARAVMIVGIPFPNAFSGEIISKKKFIEEKVLKDTGDRRAAQEATRNFYENICMRAVNQSIGRSIRHSKDYSTIYLFDQRYNTERIQRKLSGWIKQRIIQTGSFTEIRDQTSAFFKSK